MALVKSIWRDSTFSRLSMKTLRPRWNKSPITPFFILFFILIYFSWNVFHTTFMNVYEHFNHCYTSRRVGESTTWSNNSTVSAICIKERYHLVIEHNRALDSEWECICSGYINITCSLSLFRVREYDTFKL